MQWKAANTQEQRRPSLGKRNPSWVSVRMKRWALFVVSLLSACSSQPHNFVVDVSMAEKQVVRAEVIFCHGKPQQLERDGVFFQGRAIARCKRSGKLRLTYADGTTTDCSIGRVVAQDQWLGYELRGRSCIGKWSGKP